MLHKNFDSSKILITTPDYPPKLGGLSTFTKSIERALQSLGYEYDILVWDDIHELKSSPLSHKYKYGLHIHFFGCHYLKNSIEENINFIHGSEILFTSPNLLKRIYKKLFKRLFLASLEHSYFNFFISEFTLNKTVDQGLRLAYDRDIVFHNCIDLSRANLKIQNFHDPVINLVCVARDVAHKNLEYTYQISKVISIALNKTVQLFITKDFPSNEFVKVINISDVSDEERSDIFKKAHFNLLLSLDHSHRGFYEGFGLTVLEAASFGTPSIVSPHGGLVEACHHGETGWVLPLNDKDFSHFFSSLSSGSYQRVSKKAYEHTLLSHDESAYAHLLKRVLNE
ncbi:MAG: glycosyltransferase family 4 protein [Bacteriovoracaceae bacterium]|nr:glycosyltransferase family 4 protein [Bacteriovoracaceae bacterium]